MVKNALASSLLVLSLLAYPAGASAQAMQDGSGPQSPNAGVTTTDNTSEDRGLNWLWLLPLLAVPLLFLVRRDEEEEDRGFRYGDSGQFAGMKGGRARRDREVDEEEDND